MDESFFKKIARYLMVATSVGLILIFSYIVYKATEEKKLDAGNSEKYAEVYQVTCKEQSCSVATGSLANGWSRLIRMPDNYGPYVKPVEAGASVEVRIFARTDCKDSESALRTYSVDSNEVMRVGGKVTDFLEGPAIQCIQVRAAEDKSIGKGYEIKVVRNRNGT